MDSRSLSRRWTVLSLTLALVLSGIAPAAAARKTTRPGWNSVNFSGNWMIYEPLFGPGAGEELDWVYIQAYDGDFKLNKRTTRTARVIVAEAGGGYCIADEGTYDTETGYVIIGWHVAGAKVIGDPGDDEFINFITPRSGSLDTSLTLTGTRKVWEAEYLGAGACNGITVLDEEPIAKSIDIALSWSSVRTVISVPKGKGGKTREETRWETTIDSASGTLDGVDLGLPFGEWDPWDPPSYVAQSFSRSGSAMIPTGTFD